MGTTSKVSEAQRLAELQRLNILGTSSEAVFDHITRLASELFKVPIVLISMVDREKVWIKSRLGIDADQYQRKGSLCERAISQDDVLVISDTHLYPQLSERPFVAKKPDIRFYAGAPLKTRFGYNVGTLCLMDTQTRDLTGQEKEQLRVLAGIVMDEMELRLAKKPSPSVAAKKISAEKEEVARALLQERQLFMGGPTVVFKWVAKENWPVEYGRHYSSG